MFCFVLFVPVGVSRLLDFSSKHGTYGAITPLLFFGSQCPYPVFLLFILQSLLIFLLPIMPRSLDALIRRSRAKYFYIFSEEV